MTPLRHSKPRAFPTLPWLLLAGAFLLAGSACGRTRSSAAGPDADRDTGPGDTGPRTLLQEVAAIVIPNCAIGGCHDSTSITHGMDLTTTDKIHAAWVNKGGFDHCSGREVPRVIPGDPDGSLVVTKISGIDVCALSQRMPLPPRQALSAEQIAVIRAWIFAGAPSDRPQPDAGDDAPDNPTDAGDDASPDDSSAPGCSPANPCGPEQTCTGVTCGGPWECVAHFDDTVQHPCTTETIPFCGCDGVTFEASTICPNRPWAHAGACGDGVNCNTGSVACADPAPVCPAGQAPSIVNDCYGPCVDVTACRCLYHWQCPDRAVNTCLEPQYRCGPNPNNVDAAVDDGVKP